MPNKIEPLGAAARYREASERFTAAAERLGPGRLDARAAEGEWTVREIVHHTADVGIMGALRLRLMLVDVDLGYWPYDDAEFQRANHYERGIEASLALLAASAASSAEIASRLDEAAWSKPRPLPEGRTFTVGDWLRANGGHIEEHTEQLEQIERIHSALG